MKLIFVFESINSNNKRILFKKLTQSIIMIKSRVFINFFLFRLRDVDEICFFFWFFNFYNIYCLFLLMRTIEFIMTFFVIIVTNNIFKSSDFISFSFSFNIIAYFALIINVNFALIKKLRIKLIIKFIKKSLWFIKRNFEKFELSKVIFAIYARAFQSFFLHDNFDQNFFASIKYFINI